MERDRLPSEVAALCQAFLEGLREVLGENLYGVYLYGAITFPDSRDQIQDVDFHVILRRPLDDAGRVEVDRLRRLAEDFPPLGAELDGYFITLADTRRTAPPPTQLWPLRPTPVDEAWALHCAHIRAGRCIVLYGPDPLEIYPEPGWPALEAALFGEIRFVDEHLADAPAYCVLNACRLMYSFESREVVTSKRAAAGWALEVVDPEWHGLIRAALRAYWGEATGEDRAALTAGVGSFVRMAWMRIAVGRALTR